MKSVCYISDTSSDNHIMLLHFNHGARKSPIKDNGRGQMKAAISLHKGMFYVHNTESNLAKYELCAS